MAGASRTGPPKKRQRTRTSEGAEALQWDQHSLAFACKKTYGQALRTTDTTEGIVVQSNEAPNFSSVDDDDAPEVSVLAA